VKRRARLRWLIVLGIAASCDPVLPPTSSEAPVNSCSGNACAAYQQAGPAPSCTSGVCEIAGSLASLSEVIFVIDLAEDSSFAPQATFVVPYEHLGDLPSTLSTTPCELPACGHLLEGAGVTGSYVMNPCVQSTPTECAQGVGFYLGNEDQGGIVSTALPVVATYRMLEDPWNDDVVALGLPVQPVQAEPYVISLVGVSDPGPRGGPTFAFQTYLQQGKYERIIMPDSPFDVAFGPEVKAVSPDDVFDRELVTGFNATMQEPNLGATLPIFDISRADRLDGWTAYLRDATTLETISNVRTLAGTTAQGVLLLTYRPATTTGARPPDALTNAELIVAPPAGLPIPVGVFAPTGGELPAQETYPPLPQPVTMTGNIVSVDRTPVAADLVFEALAITDQNGLNDTNFEFTGYASARPGASGDGSAYSVVLPPGQYRVDVRPIDLTSAVTIAYVLVGANPSTFQSDFTVSAMGGVQGKAVVADGRLLSGATVEALPMQCSAPPAVAESDAAVPASTPASSPSCLPRPGQVTTGPDGSFTLPLDPGSYLLRVRPADGSRLPWVTHSGSVDIAPDSDAKPVSVAFSVPAPVYAGLKLLDPGGGPIVNAVVRAFAIPAPTTSSTSPPPPAIELGEAITDATGQYDLYVALPE
jgi:hypothetical protein